MSAGKSLVALSPALQVLTRTAKTTRPLVMKEVWVYIKEKNLQQPEKKSLINCDGPMKAVFGKDVLHMHEIMKGIQPHISKIPEEPSSHL